MLTLAWDDPGALAHVSWLGGWRGYSFPEHDHGDFWELVLVRRGVLEHRLAGAWERQGPGWLTLLRKGEVHALRGDEVEYVNLSFPEALGMALLKPLQVPAMAVSLQLDEGSRRRLEGDIESLVAASGQAHERAILGQIISTTVRFALEGSGKTTDGQPPWLSAMLDRLERTDPVKVTLSELRVWSGVSAEHLARSLRRHGGCTPNQLLRSRRLAKAARQLSESELTIECIAGQCGWYDLSLFHRQFRAFFGMTPGTFRARARRFIALPDAG